MAQNIPKNSPVRASFGLKKLSNAYCVVTCAGTQEFFMGKLLGISALVTRFSSLLYKGRNKFAVNALKSRRHFVKINFS
jgi:hypothetical protein